MQKYYCQAILHADSLNTDIHNQQRSVTWQQFLGDVRPILSINFQIGMNVQIHVLENSNSYLFVSMGEYQEFVVSCFCSLFYCFCFVLFFHSDVSFFYSVDKEHFFPRFGFWFPVRRDPNKEMLPSIKYAMFAQKFLYCSAVMSLGEVCLLNYYFN